MMGKNGVEESERKRAKNPINLLEVWICNIVTCVNLIKKFLTKCRCHVFAHLTWLSNNKNSKKNIQHETMRWYCLFLPSFLFFEQVHSIILSSLSNIPTVYEWKHIMQIIQWCTIDSTINTTALSSLIEQNISMSDIQLRRRNGFFFHLKYKWQCRKYICTKSVLWFF